MFIGPTGPLAFVIFATAVSSSRWSCRAFVAPSLLRRRPLARRCSATSGATDNDDHRGRPNSDSEDAEFMGVSGWKPDGRIPINPFEASRAKPTKGDLYSDDDLMNVLNIHQSLLEDDVLPVVEEKEPDSGGDELVPSIMGLHEMVLGALQEMELQEQNEEQKSQQRVDPQTTATDWSRYVSKYTVDDALRTKLGKIRAIATDVDGTLLTSAHDLHPITTRAVQDAVEAAFSPVHPLLYVFPATGKSRQGALDSLGPELGPLFAQCPGVFIQGLYVVDAAGNVIYEEKLSLDEVAAVEKLAQELDVSVFGYDGDTMFCSKHTKSSHIRDFHAKYGEPKATVLESLTSHKVSFHKCLLMDDNVDMLSDKVRPRLEELARQYSAEVTQAVPTMLEVLPSGCSKALGVEKLCDHLGLYMHADLLAIGDAENDVGMLRKAAVGIAVGNAVPTAQGAASVVLDETNDQGGAGIAMELFGLGKLL